MTNSEFLMIVSSIFTIIGILVTVYFVPYIKATIGEKNFNTILGIVEIAVKSADQLFASNEYKEKKDYVMRYVLDMIDSHFHIRLTENELNGLIEGEVQRLHHLNGTR